MRNRFIIAITLLLLLSTYKIQINTVSNSKLKIDKIIIENNTFIEEKEIIKKLSFLYDSNLFLLEKDKIKKKLNEIGFINSFQIKKVYPNKIKIKIFEKKPIAILQDKKKKGYYTANGDVIEFLDMKEFNDLPLVFGDSKNFNIFLKEIKKVNFPLDEIKTFYLFESNRWDLVTTKNQTIKLPIKDYNKSLKNFLNLKDQANFEKYKTFDYRISKQLILK